MSSADERPNPFRGLRPFGIEEDHLFFGRERIVDQLLMRLRRSRFLSIIGSSACGKSSLVKAGMIPSLYSGYMASAGSSWRVAIMRPGANPIGNLAKALTHPDILGHEKDLEETSQILIEARLMRSNHGLTDCVRLARMPAGENLLVVVDQFEELFRYKNTQHSAQAREDAVAFVKRLIHAAGQDELPIYVALTMRSDFVGECNEYPGLPEAINEGQFLVPRMTRTELRSAIVGPIKVGGADIAPRLLVRLLNDVGDNPDRLPILQHALMRTWDYWREISDADQLIDMEHYDAIGTMKHALSSHAEEAYDELGSERSRSICEKIFKALTDTITDGRGVRHPSSVEDLCLISLADLNEVTTVLDLFRRAGRSFLMPPPEQALDSVSVIDLSHESLMRVWDRLLQWTQEENTSARTYRHLARAAARYGHGTAGIWLDPELQIGLNWREANRPTKAWAERYDNAFEQSIEFLDKSKKERDRLADERRKARRRRLQTAWGVSLVLLLFAVYALVQQQKARLEQIRAEQNFHLAVSAVDEMLGDVAVENSLANIPQTEELRQQLLEKARSFYESLQQDTASDTNLRLETAVAQVRLGKIYQLQGQPVKAASANEAAIEQLNELQNEFPDRALITYRLGEAYDWYAVGIMPYDATKAEAAYNKAQKLHQGLVDRYPQALDYRHELARVHNNRAILLGGDIERREEAEQNFRRAIALFSSLAEARNESKDLWRLSRTQNGLAGLLRRKGQTEDATKTYTLAIGIVKKLLLQHPEKREYREGLARIYNNLANLQLTAGKFELALAANTEARHLFEKLAKPIPELRNEIANSYNTQGAILRSLNRNKEAASAIEFAVQQFEELERFASDFSKDPNLNSRFGGILASLAILRIDAERYEDAVRLLTRSINYFLVAVNSAAPDSGYQRNLSNAYWLLAEAHLNRGDHRAAVGAAALLARTGTAKNGLKDGQYRAALLFGSAAQLTEGDSTLGASEKDEAMMSYTSKALSLLEQAVTGGYSREEIRKESQVGGRFHHLRNRLEFKRIIAGGEQEQR